MTILVTGGSGFVGGALCRRLIREKLAVRSLHRSPAPLLAAAGVDCRLGDVVDAAAVLAATDGCDVVFHVAAKAGVWGSAADFQRANVTGTEHILQACRDCGVKRLIYTSSPSVVYHGVDESGITESTPYPTEYLTDYSRTKAIAERSVLAANSPEFATLALRPHLIWGPGDNHLMPRLISRAKSGRLRQIGDGSNIVDTTYIDNCVEAHLCALQRLHPGAACAGKAYFISNDEPAPLWDLINRMLACADLPPVAKSLSPAMAYRIGALLEFVWRLTGMNSEPPMTRFVARQLATSHWYDLTAAKRDLGYRPQISITQGLNELQTWLQSHRA